MSTNELRIVMIVVGAISLALIYFFGRPKKPKQGRRNPLSRETGGRIEPTLGDEPQQPPAPAQGELEIDEHPVEPAMQARHASDVSLPPQRAPAVGIRKDEPIERVVTLHVVARDGTTIHGSDLVVAADKAGLVFGDRGIFHRLETGDSSSAPIFSMANMVQPGSFDLRKVDALQTPGISLFMTLPGPLPALDAWEAMLPTAQRLAELLGGSVQDEERNTLGRQRVAYIRDELRAWDRTQERQRIRLR